uniref:Uncharacterized protein n=1 Tax=Setaria italica TaxID=4555 RepID=K3Z186_SETIT
MSYWIFMFKGMCPVSHKNRSSKFNSQNLINISIKPLMNPLMCK